LYCRKKKKKKSQCLGTHHKSAGPITHQWAAVQEAYISVPFFCLSSIGSSQPAAARESKGEIGSIHLLLPTGPALEATTPYHQENLGGLYFSYLLAPKTVVTLLPPPPMITLGICTKGGFVHIPSVIIIIIINRTISICVIFFFLSFLGKSVTV
jgi:hypothetical protein